MALAHTGYEVVVVISDQGGNVARRTFQMNPTFVTTDAEAQTAYDALIAALTPLTENVISDAYWKKKYAEAGTIYGTGENENVALITAMVDPQEGEVWNFQLPGPVDTIFLATSGPGYNTVDISVAALDTFGALFDPIDGPFMVSDGEGISQVASHWFMNGKRIHKKSRKG